MLQWKTCFDASLLLFLLPFGTTAQNTNFFIVPGTSGPEWNYGANLQWPLDSVQEIQWSTNFTSDCEIELWQQVLEDGGTSNGQSGNNLGTIFSSGSSGRVLNQENSFSWAVQTFQSNIEISPVFWFWLKNGSTYDGSFTSHYFNITAATVTSSSRVSPMTSTTSSTSSGSSATTTSAPTSSTTPSSSPTSSPISSSATIGLGVGLGVGLAAVLAICIWLGILLRKRRSRRDQASTSGGPRIIEVQTEKLERDVQHPAPGTSSIVKDPKFGSNSQPMEMSADWHPAELQDSTDRWRAELP